MQQGEPCRFIIILPGAAECDVCYNVCSELSFYARYLDDGIVAGPQFTVENPSKSFRNWGHHWALLSTQRNVSCLAWRTLVVSQLK